MSIALVLTLVFSMTLAVSTSLAQSCVSPPLGLVSWWQGEGTADDFTGTNPGNLQNGATFTAGFVGQAITFDGADDYVSIPASASLDVGTGNGLTIEGWIYPSDLTRSQAIVEWNNGTGGIGAHFWHSDPGVGGLGALFANLTDAFGSAHIFASAPNLLTPNVFQHVAVTYDKTTGIGTIFRNGVTVATGNLGSFTPRTDYPLYLGTRVSGSAAVGGLYAGMMDEISIYDRALSDAEIQSLYNAGNAGKCSTPAGPSIFTQPTNRTVFAGTTVTFVVGASGTSPLTYQWSFNGSPLLDATNAALVLTNLGTNQAGVYAVAITNLYDFIISSNASLTVLTAPPSILTQPTNKTVAAGQTATFVVSASGTPPLSYQWSFNAGPLLGATNTSLVLTNVGTNQAGIYAVTVTNLYGSLLSSNANLSVVILGTNLFDDFEPNIDLLQWSSLSATVLATNYGGYVSASNSLWFGGTGSRFAVTRPLITTNGGWLQFSLRIANGGLSTWETADLPGEGIVLESSTNAGSTWLEFGRFDTGAYFSWTNISVAIPANAQATNAQFRWRQLANTGATTDHWALDDVAILTVATPPVIIAQPQNQTVPVGGNAAFTVGASGTLPVTYEWRLNGTNISGGTNGSLTLSNVQPSRAGAYSVRITNPAGTVTSSNAALKVTVLTAYGNGQALTNVVNAFAAPVTIQLTNAYPGGLTFYSLDGSTPSFLSSQYNGAFVVSQSAVLRAIGYRSDFLESGELDPVTLFIAPPFLLSTATPGGGTISLNPPGGSYASNTVVTLTATPSPGWIFLKWLGDASGANSSTNLIVTRNKSVQAVFGTTLNTTAAGGGSVVLNPPGGVYPYGSVVQVSGIPQLGNFFGIWNNAASGNINPFLFTVTNANPTVSSIFGAVGGGQAALTVVPIGHGQISVNPRANVYATGSGVTITATPESGQSFIGWSGDATGTQNPLPVTLNASKLIYANFTKRPVMTLDSTASQIAKEGVRITITGDAGDAYAINVSTNLPTWYPLLYITNSFGTATFIDGAATNSPRRLYRTDLLAN